MTRAKETLTLFHRQDAPNPFLEGLNGEFLLRRTADLPNPPPPEILKLRYKLLDMTDINLGFAGRRPPDDPIHKHLSALEPGATLTPKADGSAISLHDPSGNRVARLSSKASQEWLPKIATIRQARVIGMLRRTQKDEAEAFKPRCQCEQWELPWIELIYLPVED